MQIISGKLSKPQKVVVYGPEGVGKSTFASNFPDPLFIDTEDSTVNMDVRRLPKPSSWTILLQQINYVKTNPNICKTLVVDTADWAERLCSEHICAKSGLNGIEDFGYGKGYVYLEEEFGKFLNKLQEIIEIGINVVVTAHAEIKKIEQPEEVGGYDHWQLKLEKKTMPLLKEWSDILLLANYKVYVVNVDNQGAQKGKNKAQGGKRVMYTTHTPWWDAKNRHNLADELPFDYKEIAHCIFTKEDNSQKQTKNEIQQPLQEKPKTEIEEIKEALGYSQAETNTTISNESKMEESTIKHQGNKDDFKGVPKSLADLMAPNSVTVEEIQQVVAGRGYYPPDTPIDNYDPNFISGVLVGAWQQVFKMIEDLRKHNEENTPF